ncbi:hypothetical protein [Thermomonospora cellulosilytica]|uniref:Secreted protein n=1 Tax=Thermomonospora cellulosilytica TaxID=1411118 RepID=A0A7W3N4B3_9ACTN|nr:hypothetical protein [Thermomonospora cellulosilytica]MBA9007207.1 hypothetical protein [Thermomonospora cellulosilytica]
MRMFSRIAATTAVAGSLTAAGLVGLSAPAHADAADCVAYLASVNQSSLLRTAFCEATQTAAQTVSPSVAESACLLLMAVTGLGQTDAQQACNRAVAP